MIDAVIVVSPELIAMIFPLSTMATSLSSVCHFISGMVSGSGEIVTDNSYVSFGFSVIVSCERVIL